MLSLVIVSVRYRKLYVPAGSGVIHSVANILIIYTVLVVWGGSHVSVILAFLINMVYLCAGYYTHVHNTNYVITWTTPHCVLTLRLIGLAFDVYDGRRRQVRHMRVRFVQPAATVLVQAKLKSPKEIEHVTPSVAGGAER